MANFKYAILDSTSMFTRCMRLSFRNLDVLLTSVILPVMMMLLFVYLFGGAINVGETGYVNYVVPAVMVLTIGYCAALTAVSINSDMTKGIVDRFRSMPISKSSVLMGHVLTPIARNCISTTLVIIVALLIGFRPQASIVEWLIITGIVILYMLVITWFAVLFGLIAKTAEGAGSFSFIILMLPYFSSGFVPTSTMPAALRVVAEKQPLTPIIESLRNLSMQAPADEYILPALIWCICLLIIAFAAPMKMYNRRVSN